MAKFCVKVRKTVEALDYLYKLRDNFENVNAKNILLKREMTKLDLGDNWLLYIDMKPQIPNFMFYGSLFALLLAFIFRSKFFVIFTFGLAFMSLFWTKYFFYLMLKNNARKHNVEVELI